jgi:hypothetical protein
MDEIDVVQWVATQVFADCVTALWASRRRIESNQAGIGQQAAGFGHWAAPGRGLRLNDLTHPIISSHPDKSFAIAQS